MSKFIKQAVKDIEISGIRTFNALANHVDGVIKLTIGELDVNTPEIVKIAAIKAISNNQTRYTENKGILELRKKIAEKYKHYASDEVILTVGTTEGLGIVLKSIIDEGDEVIIPTPGYVGYLPLITLEKGIVKTINTIKDDHKITKESLLKAYSKHTKALIITNPNNPTGNVLSLPEMELIKDFVLEKDIVLISDEIYSSIVFEKEFYSFSKYPELKTNLVILNGFSKSHAMTGFRIGYVVSNIEMINHFVKVHQYNVTSTSTISQYAALEAIDVQYDSMVKSLSHKRNLVLQSLDELGFPYIPSNGAFYVFFDISKYKLSSYDYCVKLLNEFKVALIPGEYFLGNHKEFVRLSYAVSEDKLIKALELLKAFDQANS